MAPRLDEPSRGRDLQPTVTFHAARPITPGDLDTLTERVRKRLIRWFRRAGLLDAEAAANMLACEHSGFSVDASVRISLDDRDVPSYTKSLEHLVRYCARPAFALLAALRLPRSSCPRSCAGRRQEPAHFELELHRLVLRQTGVLEGVRDLGGLESAVAQPKIAFGGQDLYPCLPTKAAALGFSPVCNHPFIDGNNGIGHLSMEMFLVLNSHKLAVGVDKQERIILSLAAGDMNREEFAGWVRSSMRP